MTLLRLDFSKKVGFGHLKRSLFLAKEKLKRKNLVIVCKECVEDIVDIPLIKIKDEKEFFEIVKKINPKEIIIDNYEFECGNEKKLKTLFPKIKLICIDDLYKQHFCDEIINFNIYAKRYKYKDLPSFTKIKLIKPAIRNDFKKVRKIAKKEGIFLSIGATDSKNLSLKILKTLKPLKIKVNLFTTSANTNLDTLEKFAFLNRWVNLNIDKNIAVGMSKSKFGIISASSLVYEAMYMKLPFIAIESADNQKYVSRFLKSRGVKVLKDNEVFKLKDIYEIYSRNRI